MDVEVGNNADKLSALKQKLRKHAKHEIIFNEPHFSQQLALRGGNREEVIDNILNPDKLMYSYQETGRQGDTKYSLHFKLSNTRTLRIPVIFLRGKILVLTYILRYRNWQNMVK